MSLTGPILYIEDDEDDQHLVQTVVEALQIVNPLRFFADGHQALDYLANTTEKPLLILCDINMPHINGLELRRRINEDDYLRKKAIPFIFFTTAANRKLVELAYSEMMVQGFYRKADSYAQLKEQLRLIITYWLNCLHPNSDLDKL